jgi:hypothetical protein
MSELSEYRERVAEVLAIHDDVMVDVTTPRQYTAHGGWNKRCGCGEYLTDEDGEALELAHRAHLADALLAPGNHLRAALADERGPA